jgi:hypothetical protein
MRLGTAAHGGVCVSQDAAIGASDQSRQEVWPPPRRVVTGLRSSGSRPALSPKTSIMMSNTPLESIQRIEMLKKTQGRWVDHRTHSNPFAFLALRKARFTAKRARQ